MRQKALPERESARDTLAGVVAQLQPAAPKIARLLAAAEDDLLAYMRFPREHTGRRSEAPTRWT